MISTILDKRSIELVVSSGSSSNGGKEDKEEVVYEVIGSDLTKEYVEVNAAY
jgi:N-acetylglutamate synthase/N-acetylornithine aminotransferase